MFFVFFSSQASPGNAQADSSIGVDVRVETAAAGICCKGSHCRRFTRIVYVGEKKTGPWLAMRQLPVGQCRRCRQCRLRIYSPLLNFIINCPKPLVSTLSLGVFQNDPWSRTQGQDPAYLEKAKLVRGVRRTDDHGRDIANVGIAACNGQCWSVLEEVARKARKA